jgi:hypothetical protein
MLAMLTHNWQLKHSLNFRKVNEILDNASSVGTYSRLLQEDGTKNIVAVDADGGISMRNMSKRNLERGRKMTSFINAVEIEHSYEFSH